MPAEATFTPGLISIIIPTRDRRAELAQCLASIARQNYPAREVIVVDDCSTDDTASFVAATHPEVRVLTNERRWQPAHLRNQGLRAARGEFVLFLDSDSELPWPDSLSTMVRVLKENPGFALLGGEIKATGPCPEWAYGRNVAFNGETWPVTASVETPNALVRCDYVATCNCFGRAEAMRKAGGFDPFFGFGGEDVDFCLRVARRRCAVSYATAVFHKQSPRGRNPDETRRYHRARVRQQFKNAHPFHVIAGFGYDLGRALLFYAILLPKILVMLARGRALRRENFTGGWLFLWAYVRNIRDLGTIRAARSADFLSDEQMQEFERAGHDT